MERQEQKSQEPDTPLIAGLATGPAELPSDLPTAGEPQAATLSAPPTPSMPQPQLHQESHDVLDSAGPRADSFNSKETDESTVLETLIIAVLKAFDGRSLPKLPINITLNTFLAFFATSYKAAFMTVLGEIIGQWKWNMTKGGGNHKSRNNNGIYKFDLLDNSSRGPWGSWLTIVNFKWRHLVSALALLSLASALTSPITQQMSVKHLDAKCAIVDCDFEPYSSAAVW
ncbi:hypothetical protein OQA88_9140 [Cercophora sp. LCS_1]